MKLQAFIFGCCFFLFQKDFFFRHFCISNSLFKICQRWLSVWWHLIICSHSLWHCICLSVCCLCTPFLCSASLSAYAYVSSLYATIPSIAIRCLIKISFTFNDLMSIPLIIIFIHKREVMSKIEFGLKHQFEWVFLCDVWMWKSVHRAGDGS